METDDAYEFKWRLLSHKRNSRRRRMKSVHEKSNKNRIFRSFKSKENIHNKDDGPDYTFSNKNSR